MRFSPFSATLLLAYNTYRMTGRNDEAARSLASKLTLRWASKEPVCSDSTTKEEQKLILERMIKIAKETAQHANRIVERAIAEAKANDIELVKGGEFTSEDLW